MKRTLWIVTAMACLATPVLAGMEITMKSVSEGDAASRNKSQAGTTITRMTVAGDKARIDFVEGTAPGGADGGYLLTPDAGKTFYMVSPKDKTYMKWDIEAMMGMAGAMGGMMKMQVTDPKMETVLDEAGPSLLGYPTRHYKFRTSYQMSMSIMGFKNQMSTVKEDETWATTKLDVSAFRAWMNKTPKTQNAELDKLIAMESEKITGLPLKTLSVQTTTDSQGKATVSRTSMEVTGIRNASEVPVELPADYKEIDLFHAAAEAQEGGEARPATPKRSSPRFNIGDMMKKALESAQ